MSRLADALAESRADDRRKAARALLKRPLLRAAGDDLFATVRRHAPELRDWFERNTGWRLHVDSEVARLVKQPAGVSDPTHPARDPRSKRPFSRRRYVLTCLALAALERSDAQITLGRLAEDVVAGATDPELTSAGVSFTLEQRDERADLVSVVRLLLGFGVLSRVAGDEDAFIAATGDALYDVERRVLSTLLAAPRGPSTITATAFEQQLDDLTAEIPPTTDDLRNQRIRYRLTRRLLEEPVVYYAELDEHERAYLTGQRAAIANRINELTGMVAEVRAEGIAMVDPADDLTDVRMPESGTDGHATLLLAEHLAAAAGAVPLGDLHAELRRLALAHKSYWRRGALEPGAEVQLAETALGKLAALRLVTRTATEVTALPALSRYAVGAPTMQGEA
ncbi:MAG: TIGR02678 family protein [Thermocrispum sp.]